METEPSPRWGQFSAVVEEELCVYGGVTEDFINPEENELASSVHSFDLLQESWTENICSGVPPPGLYNGGCAATGDHLYVYGGYDGSHHQCSLHQLNTKSWSWKLVSNSGPMRKLDCGMVMCGSKLVLFGGYGIPSGPTQPGAQFTKDSRFTDGRGWTNELHTFDLKEGKGVWYMTVWTCHD
jgi:N-acetylneuraminic acid mutarotase